MRMEPLEPRRVRHPRGAYGWVDLKVVTGGFLERLESGEALTYLFLCAVGNTLGISFWSTARMAQVLHLDAAVVRQALETLVATDLIAWNGRVVQVLPLPESAAGRPEARRVLRADSVPAATASLPPPPEPVVDAVAVCAREPEAREQLERFLGRRKPSEAVVRAVAKGLALKNLKQDQSGPDKRRSGS